MLLLLALPLFINLGAHAMPLPNGATAPDFTLTDLDGVTHNLYDYLDQGYTVMIDFSATWCGPCWNYHNTHILADLWNQHGPPGANDVMVFFIEGDPSTPVSSLYGGSGSQGNWVAGTPYPIMDDGNGSVAAAYNITFFPTLYAVCPDRKIYTIGQASLQTWINWISSCNMEASASITNAPCFGQPGGSINLTATGGYGNKTYLWSNGANTEDISNLMAGNYAVTVTESNGRTVNLNNLTVGSPPAISVSTTSTTNVSCNGGNNGAATVSASGGTPGYAYSWSNGANGPTASNLTAGSYTVSVSDSRSCLKTHNVVITQPQPLNGSAQAQGANCGNSDGSVLITPSGGSYPYTFNIGNGPSPIPVFTNLAAGNYTVTITDGHNCVKTVPFAVPDIPGPVAEAGPAQIINCANPETTLDGTGSSSGSNIAYEWTTANGHIVHGGNTATPTVDQPGVYQLEVTNLANGCSSVDQVVVDENNDLPTATVAPAGELDCLAPELTLDGAGSSEGPEYTYTWTTTGGNIVSGENTLAPVVNAGGVYTLTVLNTISECESTATVEVEANQDFPVANGGANGVINCNAAELTLDGSGSSTGAEFTYLWTTTNGNIVSGANTLTPVVDAGGDYVLLVTNTLNGCEESDEILVSEDLVQPVADAGPDMALNCNMATLTLDGSGSSSGPQFEYLWTTTNGNIASGETTPTPTVDQAGEYVLQVANTVNGCVTTESAVVVENSPVEAAVESVTHALCAGGQNGSATVVAANGAEPYAYAWPGGLSGPSQSGLAAGSYTVTITDADECTDLVTLLIEEPALLVANASATGETGLGNNDGTATANPQGGVGPYSYLWSNGATEQTAVGLAPGTYTVTITDANGCTTQESVTVNSFSCTISATVSAQHITCFGDKDGEASVAINNGLEPYAITWSNGAEGPTAAGLPPGTYTVSITDENNCPTTANVTITEPTAVALSVVEVQDALCFGQASGQATVEGAGGVGGYSYLWPSGNTAPTETNLAAGTYVATLTDANGCETTTSVDIGQPQELTGNVSATGESSYQGNDGELSVAAAGGNPAYQYLWSNGETTPSISGLAPGEYTVVISDENGCTTELSGTVGEYACPQVDIIATVDGVSCAGAGDGAALLSGSGGTAPYSYTWPNGETGPSVTGLAGGVYEVNVQDGANCPYTVEVVIPEPEALSAQIVSQENIECAGQTDGSATVEGLGGVPGYSYAWSGGAAGATAENLAPGFHQVTVTDVNGCTSTLELEIIISDDNTFPVIIVQDIILALDENGQAGLTPAMIDNGSYDNCGIESMAVSPNVFDCSYLGIQQEVTFTVLDVNGNESTATAIVTVVDEIAPVITCPEPIEVYNCDGLVEYELPAATDACDVVSVDLIEGLGSGANFPIGVTTETYMAMDASGNMSMCSFEVAVVNTLEISGSSSPTCPEAADGSAVVEAAGGTPGYSYLWSTGAATPVADGLAAGSYEVTVFDATGCEMVMQIEVASFPPIEMVVDEVTAAQNGEPNGSAKISITNGTGPFTYEWRDQENYLFSTQEDLENAFPGIYVLTITDANGCVFVANPIEIGNISGTQEPAWSGGVWVYPNPAKDQVNVRIKLDAAAAVQMQVFDMKGVQMAIEQTDALAQHDLEVASIQWPSGVYYIRLVIDGEVLVRRVVVE